MRGAEPLVLVSEVAAMAAAQVNAPGWEAEAERIAADIACERDWAGRPVVTWTVAAQLLARMKAARARLDRERSERERAVMAAEADVRRFLGGGIVGIELPGQAPVYTDDVVLREPGPVLVERP